MIFINNKKINNIIELIIDPSVSEAASIWGKEGMLEKSSINLSVFKTPFGSISLLYGPRQIGKTASLKLFLTQVNDSETIIFTDCSAILDKADLARHLAELIRGKPRLSSMRFRRFPDGIWRFGLCFQRGNSKIAVSGAPGARRAICWKAGNGCRGGAERGRPSLPAPGVFGNTWIFSTRTRPRFFKISRSGI